MVYLWANLVSLGFFWVFFNIVQSSILLSQYNMIGLLKFYLKIFYLCWSWPITVHFGNLKRLRNPSPIWRTRKGYTGCINKPKKFLKVTLESFGKSLMVPLACQWRNPFGTLFHLCVCVCLFVFFSVPACSF